MRTRTAAIAAALALTFGGMSVAPASADPPEDPTADRDPSTTVRRAPAAVPVAPAAANVRGGAIVFVRGGNVWLVRGDGSGLYQVTTGGGYKTPSMANNGTIVAMRGDLLVVMRQNGQLVRAFEPEDLFPHDPTTINLTPALDPVISPDGTRVAYAQGRLRASGPNLEAEVLSSVTSVARPTLSRIWIGSDPTWVTNNRVVLSDNGGIDLANVGAVPDAWFSTSEIDPFFDDPYRFYGAYDPQLAPNGSHVVMTIDGDVVLTARVTGNPRTSTPAPPASACVVSDDGPASDDDLFSRATYAPDSASIVYANRGRLTVVRNIDACNATSAEKVLLTGTSDPYWSAAALNPPPKPKPRPTIRPFSLKKRPKVVGKARVGRKLAVTKGTWSPRPAKVSYRWFRGSKKVSGGAGAKASYRLKRADRGKRMRVKVTVRRSGYRTKTVWSTSSRRVKR